MSTPERGSRDLLVRLVRPYRGRVAAAMTLALVENALGVITPLLIAAGIDIGLPAAHAGDWAPLAWIIAGYAGAGVLSALTKHAFLRYSGRIAQRMLLDLRRLLFGRILGSSQSFHESYGSGPLVSRMTNDIEALNDLLEMGLDGLFSALLSTVACVAAMLWLDLPLGLVVLACLAPMWPLVRWFLRWSRHNYRRVRAVKSTLTGELMSTLDNMRAVKSFRVQDRSESAVAAADREYLSAKSATGSVNGRFTGSVVLLGNLTLVLVIGIGAARIAAGMLPLGELAAFLLYVQRLFDPIDELASFANAYSSASTALEKVAELLRSPVSLPATDRPVPLPTVAGKTMRLNSVRFRYRREGPWVLDGLTLDLAPGHSVALVGPTGAGKSTIAKLLARFYDPDEGAVTMDGIDLRSVADPELRRAVVLVPQEPFLFSGTVADNIGFGDPAADRDAIIRAARTVGAHEFIAALPEGYDTDLHRRGARLSAGQRQLVSLARVVLADPPVLILDEATAALDAAAERTVRAATATVLSGRTALVIAHRLSTVAETDRVVVLDGGRVVEDGPPAQLAAEDGRFAMLLRSASTGAADATPLIAPRNEPVRTEQETAP
ncbi:ABC transporter ATP-binding protein [Saccharopolyspora phatthalungensis]|uniref:ABC-type multidrug transport system fused ATPase/permease subunit n=1 Tax=Saccharopolyspora phatthalungensis TaxID=664693 RepID=A0A840QFG7_9PSEU|nr:ABC transporter ATP-binding protein [Saccharopolyspora phatthalungensis]MBB5158811.1 ABC-type multidrug transport system fused ATPase/permease subunit [Saccharopolyspora phatthalungensis]